MGEYISWSPIRKLMKDLGATIVQKEALEELIKFLETDTKKIINRATEHAKHANRKKITIEDIKIAIELM